MSVRVQRRFDLDAPIEDVWDIISDPAVRAKAISVVERFERSGETTIWHIRLPIPLLRKTIRVRTRDVEIEPPKHVRFRGTSKAFTVQGEHTIRDANGGAIVDNEFVVDGRIPGVETFFRRNLDKELVNLEAALKTRLREE